MISEATYPDLLLVYRGQVLTFIVGVKVQSLQIITKKLIVDLNRL